MTSRTLSAATAILALLTLAQIATAYDWEADLIFADSDSSSDPVYGANIKYFFSPVTHGTNNPWVEIPFTERISDLSVGTVYSDQEFPYGYKSETQAYAIAYNHRNPNSPHTYSLGLGYELDEISVPRITYGYPNAFPIHTVEQFDLKSYNYGIGYSYYLQDEWSIGTTLILNESSQADQYSIKLSTKRIWELGNQTWFGLEASIAHNTFKTINFEEDNVSFELQGSYYLSPRTELSAELKFPDSGKPRKMQLGIQHFLTDSTFIAIAYSYTELAYSLQSIGPDGNIQSDENHSAFQAKFGLRF